MCATYGIDPRFSDHDLIEEEADSALLEGIRAWAERNAGEALRPTGRHLRNLNPIVVDQDGTPALELGWWGFLVDGLPSRFPSINTRSERLQERPGNLRGRAIVPATRWFEMQKPNRVWHEFGLGGGALFGMAAITQRGRAEDGSWFTCYSIVMRPAPERLAGIHDRVPVLLPAAQARDWLTAPASRAVMDDALLASDEPTRLIETASMTAKP